MTQKLTEKEKRRWHKLSHTPNSIKTDEEFKDWQELRRKVGVPVPTEKHRYSTQRALHDKYDEDDK